jgi:hypothetical protein
MTTTIRTATAAAMFALLLPGCDRLKSTEAPPTYRSSTLETAQQISGNVPSAPAASAASAAAK